MLPSLASFVTLRAWRQRRGARTTRFCVRISAVRPHETIASVAATSIASRLACRDDREAPLLSKRDADTILLICGSSKAEYFLPKGWTAFLKNCQTGKSPGLPAASLSSPTRRKSSTRPVTSSPSCRGAARPICRRSWSRRPIWLNSNVHVVPYRNYLSCFTSAFAPSEMRLTTVLRSPCRQLQNVPTCRG